MRRKGSISDWHELLPVLDAYHKGHITFARFAELGREWLEGETSSELRRQLPQSQVERIRDYVVAHPGAFTQEIADGIGLDRARVTQLIGRLRERQQVRTVTADFRMRVWPLSERERGKTA